MQIIIPVSVGELLDKISILQIKEEKIKNKEKLSDILKENVELQKIAIRQIDNNKYQKWLDELKEINLILWDVEDKLRKKEELEEFDKEFIDLARDVYYTNDKRFEIKNRINKETGSDIKEQKEYTNYIK